MDLRLFCNRTLAVAGPSHSGKTTFVLQLLDNRHAIFDCTPKRVVWCYGIYQHDLNAALQQRGFITHSDIISDVTAMFTRAAHHKPCFIIFIMQNLFPPGKESRSRSLNVHYYCLYKNPRDKSQVEFLARQIRPRNPKALIEVFEAATEQPHSYLFLDLTQEWPESLRFRSNLFEPPIVIYQVAKA